MRLNSQIHMAAVQLQDARPRGDQLHPVETRLVGVLSARTSVTRPAYRCGTYARRACAYTPRMYGLRSDGGN
jgi:hypothetical protein